MYNCFWNFLSEDRLRDHDKIFKSQKHRERKMPNKNSNYYEQAPANIIKFLPGTNESTLN